MSEFDETQTQRYELQWGELTATLISDATGDQGEEGTCSVATLTLIDHAGDEEEELGSETLMVRDDDPQAEQKLNDSPAYEAVEDKLLTRFGLTRAQAQVTTRW